MKESAIIAHIYKTEDSWNIQTNKQHCEGVAALAERFASEFGMGSWGKFLGLLHDRGKESEGFQSYIKRVSEYDTSSKSEENKDHSYIGAIIAHKHPFDSQLYWLSNPIAAHHGGLYDTDELQLLLKKPIPKTVSTDIPNVTLSLPHFKLNPTDSAYIVRMLYSCLVDADWLDTEAFMSPQEAAARGSFSSLAELDEKLETYRKRLIDLPKSDLNLIRTHIQENCEKAADAEPGYFDLTVPTGGGKTIASVIWALKHAIKHNKKRIIIAIPFTSIIVQTASILRAIFGAQNVIEHHSVVNEEFCDNSSLLACENWDAPIIITTNVQLFESIYSNRRSSCRKLHSIANSVVILDEVQALPLAFLQPVVESIKAYKKLFSTSFLFCTASQPILYGNHKGTNQACFIGFDSNEINHIIPSSFSLHAKLRRADITFSKESFSYHTLAERLRQHKRVLCIVNSRKHALNLFEELNKDSEIPTFHLSRSMCGDHIMSTIEQIKSILATPEKAIRVISTQLIEAGVDIDFPIVYRQMAGLDSILQAAGRCNREGKYESGQTVVFDFEKDKKYGLLSIAADTMNDLSSVHPDTDWQDPQSMKTYFRKLYRRTPYFDKENIIEMQSKLLSCQYEEISRKFRMIDAKGKEIVVNFGNAKELLQQIRQNGISRKLSRELGRFCVTVPDRIFLNFQKAHLLEEVMPGIFFLSLQEQYDELVGLKSDNQFLEQNYII